MIIILTFLLTRKKTKKKKKKKQPEKKKTAVTAILKKKDFAFFYSLACSRKTSISRRRASRAGDGFPGVDLVAWMGGFGWLDGWVVCLGGSSALDVFLKDLTGV